MKLPKFYNPFKAHIVQFANDKFAVRKLSGFFWLYKENTTYKSDDIYWWYDMSSVIKWCMVDTLEEAKALREKQKINPRKTRVIHG